MGISHITITDVTLEGESGFRKQVSIETSTPQARAFLDGFMQSPVFAQERYTLTSREVRAIVNGESIASLTHPMGEPLPEVVQDLWQLSHLTSSYIARAGAGAIVMATGLIENNAIAIVAAALFLPFLSQVLAVSIGIHSRDRRLVLHGLQAIMASTGLAFMGGALVGWLEGGPVLFTGFRGPLASFGISAAIGVTAGLATADDTGRRYLIGVAAAVQLAIFPVWLGAVAVAGSPPGANVTSHLVSFLINLFTIAGTALLSYALLRLKEQKERQ